MTTSETRIFVGDNGSVPSCEVGGSSRCPTCRLLPRPAPGAGWTRRPGYEAQWRRLSEAALELGLGPGAAGRDRAGPAGRGPRLEAGHRRAVQQGRPVRRDRAAAGGRRRNPIRPSWTCARSPRCAARTPSTCAPSPGARWRWRWPAPVGAFRSLRRDQVHATARRLLVATDDGEWAVPGALTAWHAWETVRGRFPALAASPWVLPALRRGPGLDSQIGGRLSNQALQVTFTKHARRTAQHLRATAAPSRREAGRGAGRGLPGAVLRLLPPARARRRRPAGVAARRRPGRPGARPARAPRWPADRYGCCSAGAAAGPGSERARRRAGSARSAAGRPAHPGCRWSAGTRSTASASGGRGRERPPAGAHVTGQTAGRRAGPGRRCRRPPPAGCRRTRRRRRP